MPGFSFLAAGKPEQRLLEVAKSPNGVAVQGTQERKQSGPVVGVGTVKNRQAILPSETHFAKCAHKFSQVSRAKHGLRTWVQRPQIQHRMGDAPFPAHTGKFGQGSLAGRQVEVTLCAKPDEFTGADDLKFLWHNKGGVRARLG